MSQLWSFIFVIIVLTAKLAVAKVKQSIACHEDGDTNINWLWCFSITHHICVWQTNYNVTISCKSEPDAPCHWRGNQSETESLRNHCLQSQDWRGYCTVSSRLTPPEKSCAGSGLTRSILYTCELRNPFAEDCITAPTNLDDTTNDQAAGENRSSDACHGAGGLDHATNSLRCEPETHKICITEARYYQFNESSTCQREISSTVDQTSCCVHTEDQCHWNGDTTVVAELRVNCTRSRDDTGQCKLPARGGLPAPSGGPCSGVSSVRSLLYTCERGPCPPIVLSTHVTDMSTQSPPTGTTIDESFPSTVLSTQSPSTRTPVDAALAGGVVGAIVFVAVITAIIVVICRRKRLRGKGRNAAVPPVGEEYYESVSGSLPMENIRSVPTGTDAASVAAMYSSVNKVPKSDNDQGTMMGDPTTYDHIPGDQSNGPLMNEDGTYDHVPNTEHLQTVFDETNLNEDEYDRLARTCPPRPEQQDDQYDVLDKTRANEYSC